MKKQKIIKSFVPYLIVILGLLFAGSIASILTSPLESDNSDHSESKIQGVATVSSTPTPIPQPSISVKTKPSIKTVSYNTPRPTPRVTSTPIPSSIPANNFQTNNSILTQVVTPTSIPAQDPQTIHVNVSITASDSLLVNGSSSFSVSVSEGSNQCDVLTKALADRKISSLNMRHDSNLGTYAVYQINRIGKENSVWWTYLVNSQSPNQGCSYIKAKNNDNVEWKYIGS